jgi:hypothetical protein
VSPNPIARSPYQPVQSERRLPYDNTGEIRPSTIVHSSFLPNKSLVRNPTNNERLGDNRDNSRPLVNVKGKRIFPSAKPDWNSRTIQMEL